MGSNPSPTTYCSALFGRWPELQPSLRRVPPSVNPRVGEGKWGSGPGGPGLLDLLEQWEVDKEALS